MSINEDSSSSSMVRMERGVLVFRRAIDIIAAMASLDSDEVAAVIQQSKKEIADEYGDLADLEEFATRQM